MLVMIIVIYIFLSLRVKDCPVKRYALWEGIGIYLLPFLALLFDEALSTMRLPAC